LQAAVCPPASEPGPHTTRRGYTMIITSFATAVHGGRLINWRQRGGSFEATLLYDLRSRTACPGGWRKPSESRWKTAIDTSCTPVGLKTGDNSLRLAAATPTVEMCGMPALISRLPYYCCVT